jgi:hypothetical protein
MESAISKSSSLIDAQTQAYRQVACLLAAGSIRKLRNTSVATTTRPTKDPENDCTSNNSNDCRSPPAAVEVAHYFLPKHPGYVPASLLRAVSETSSESEVLKGEALSIRNASGKGNQQPEVYLPVCNDCGGALQPGWSGTSSRLQKSTPHLNRTARRRASRRKAATLKQQRQEQKTTSTSKNQQRSNLWQYCQQQQSSTPLLLSLDCCKNHATITCGSCGGTSTIPGISNPKPIRSKSIISNSTSRTNANQKSHNIQTTRGVIVANANLSFNHKQRNPDTAVIRNNDAMATMMNEGNEEFISLAPASSGTTAPPAVPVAKRRKDPPKLGEPKKKRKKKPGELMSFLSSLND